MRLWRTALILCGLAEASMSFRPAAAATLALEECRLEHPLRLTSLAARCGRLEVPEDPSRPQGAGIALHIAVIPALNRRAAAAPLFLLAGGPGQSASDLYTTTAAAFARVNRRHDIVLVDQRGTGHSGPLDCSYPEDWESGHDEAAQELPRIRRATLDCLAKYGQRVRFYTTSAAVGDLERVRAALGYTRIDLYGSSYGTRVAQLYMRRFPQATHAVVLDGVTYPEQAIGPDTPADGERALQLIVARCREAQPCATAFPDLGNELTALRRRFGSDQQPLVVSDPGEALPLEIEFNRSMLNGALRFLSYNSTQASLLPVLLHEAAHGNLAPLGLQAILLARQIPQQLASGMQNSVICTEDVPLFASAGVDQIRIAQTYQGTDQLEALEAICTLWPRGPMDVDLHRPLHSDIPTLLLSGEADPVTPPADAERAAQGLTRHRNLVLGGEGHGQMATGCMPTLMAEFLDDPIPEKLDATCLGRHHPAPFFISFEGPEP